MARYIDAKLLDETIDKYQTELESNINSIWYKNKPLYKGLAYLRRIIREEIPTADVAPKSEVAREIFEEIYEDCFDQFGYIDYEKLAQLKKKYTEENK